ncbi:hypothetical protein N9N28_05930 [Rubripirellula amarantea]|uniref:Uncharacterized protein n=1 Tax=Rubripirellula amarantea TaxID=2527999 RepID=A0A5C5WQQ6_9BACT|nr:hypothetical protein [Rubripirellula amarantea]MDA8744154.1 hypothetical protein [Rubripirellula amarantea]TWT53224.1 hypothetical protein Pla22_08520 [Rubripirellula amarantea]
MLPLNPYLAPSSESVELAETIVQVVRRDIAGFGSTLQVYQFACQLTTSRLFDRVIRFFEGNKATHVFSSADALTFTRATTGWWRFVSSNEREITQRINVKAVPSHFGVVCRIEYKLEHLFQLYVPPHNLQTEVTELAKFARSL